MSDSATLPVKTKKPLPTTPILVLLAILVVAVIALLAWALYNYQLLMSRDISLAQNPYCIRFACKDDPDGVLKAAYQLDSSQDPQKAAYQTINWCTVNAPPESLTNALQTCSETGVASSELSTRLTDFAQFYNDSYVSTCGYTWKTSKVPVSNTNKGPEVTDPNNPTNPNGTNLNGANDFTMVYLIACYDQVSDVTNPAIESLRTKCGTACQKN